MVEKMLQFTSLMQWWRWHYIFLVGRALFKCANTKGRKPSAPSSLTHKNLRMYSYWQDQDNEGSIVFEKFYYGSNRVSIKLFMTKQIAGISGIEHAFEASTHLFSWLLRPVCEQQMFIWTMVISVFHHLKWSSSWRYAMIISQVSRKI